MQSDNQYLDHWEQKFSSRKWGRYPPEDLVRFVCQTYHEQVRENLSILEIGCGPGANLWFLHREGFRVYGIDSSKAAIEIAGNRLRVENSELNPIAPKLSEGDFSSLPWKDKSFNLVVDIFSLYANPLSIIVKTLTEVERVLKPGGKFYSKLWGKRTTGYGTGDQVELGTFDNIPEGPCKNMGRSHFFDIEEISKVFHNFTCLKLETVLKSDQKNECIIEEFHCVFEKPI